MTDARTDRDLMRAVAADDRDAFREIVARYGDRITGFLCRFLNDRERALDLAQEAFLRLYQRLRAQPAAEAADRGRCTALLFTIAANLGRDELRRRAVRKEVPMDGALAERPAGGMSPEVVVERREMHERVQRSLDALPPDTKALLVWREVQGLSYEEIAVILDVRLGTVKSRINRARVAFKNQFFAFEKPPGDPSGGSER
jgi:RNA polymerase sigma-70 factor, ECF subfamily